MESIIFFRFFPEQQLCWQENAEHSSMLCLLIQGLPVSCTWGRWHLKEVWDPYVGGVFFLFCRQRVSRLGDSSHLVCKQVNVCQSRKCSSLLVGEATIFFLPHFFSYPPQVMVLPCSAATECCSIASVSLKASFLLLSISRFSLVYPSSRVRGRTGCTILHLSQGAGT